MAEPDRIVLILFPPRNGRFTFSDKKGGMSVNAEGRFTCITVF
jgi:hypothetical protein